MTKYFFAFLILLHGLIHFMGFSKAFGYGNITQLTKEIVKPAGFFWFTTAVLFILASALLLAKKNTWSVVAIIAAVISQVLIITEWKDAKFGTIANITILLIAVPDFASVTFSRRINREAAAMFSITAHEKTIVTRDMLNDLPPAVQQWLIHSGIVGKPKTYFVRLKQAGEMRTKPNSKWMHFTATQYFTVEQPGFNWQAKVQLFPVVSLNGRDRFENGKGEMLIKVFGLLNLVNASGTDKMNQSTMLRYLAEICWFPSAALSDYIKWEAVDATSAKATMNYKSATASGIFKFDTNGDMISFTADRWYGSDNNATLEKWFVETNGYARLQGIRIPLNCEVSWKLNKGDFNWLYLRVTDLEYNKPELYK